MLEVVPGNQRGVALLLTLLTISFLVVMTVRLLGDVKQQINDAANIRETVRLDSMVDAGLSLAQAAIYSDLKTNAYDTFHDSWAGFSSEQLQAFTGEISLEIAVTGLSGLLQINTLLVSNIENEDEDAEDSEETPEEIEEQQQAQAVGLYQIWIRFLLSGRFAVEDEQQAIEILDSILDWLDADDDERPYGAETGYYQSLTTPYNCNNGLVAAAEELLLVKGITPQLFYGDGEYEGIGQYLTAAEETGKINLNTAPAAVLGALSSQLDTDMVEELIEYRAEPDNKENLADVSWYLEAIPGDVILDEKNLTVKTNAFQIKLTAVNNGFKRVGTGIITCGEKGAQTLLRWHLY